MSLAFVLLKCNDGSEKQVIREIREIDEVKEAEETFGPFGAVVKIESSTEDKVKRILNEKIQNINGISSSMTLVTSFDANNTSSNNIDDSKPSWEEVRGLSWMFYED